MSDLIITKWFHPGTILLEIVTNWFNDVTNWFNDATNWLNSRVFHTVAPPSRVYEIFMIKDEWNLSKCSEYGGS